MATPSVWIVNKGYHPYGPAEKFGTLKVLTEGRVNIFSVDNLCNEIWTKLEDGGAGENDILLMSGYAMLNMIAGNYFSHNFGRYKVLVWGANFEKYKILTIPDFKGWKRVG